MCDVDSVLMMLHLVVVAVYAFCYVCYCAYHCLVPLAESSKERYTNVDMVGKLFCD